MYKLLAVLVGLLLLAGCHTTQVITNSPGSSVSGGTADVDRTIDIKRPKQQPAEPTVTPLPAN